MDENKSENRISVLSIVVEDTESAAKINELLHTFDKYIVGRLGIPYKEKAVSVICVVMDAPPAAVSSLSGKIGRLNGVSVKTVTSKL